MKNIELVSIVAGQVLASFGSLVDKSDAKTIDYYASIAVDAAFAVVSITARRFAEADAITASLDE